MTEECRYMLLTGASRGIGHATVKLFQSKGWRILTVSRQPFAQECAWPSARESHIQADLADLTQIDRLAATVRERLPNGRLHALVNNAGISPKGPGKNRLGVLDTDAGVWTQVLNVNLVSTALIARALMSELEAAKGSIVNVTSIAGSRVHPFAGVAYAASKAALASLTREMAHEFGQRGVRANAIAPGEIETSILPRLRAVHPPNWDAVQVEAEELALGCADGLYETIDWDKMGGKGKFLESAVNDCGVGAIVWSTAIAYDGDKLKEGPVSWADFWNVEKFPGKRSLRKGPKYTLEFALLADGVSKDELYDVLATDEGVERAFKKLGELKPHIVWWESGAQPLQFLASGEVAMTSAYNGRITGINRTEGKNFKVVWPGSIYAVDSWVVLKDAENKDAAQDFIAFASLPEHQAKLPEFVAYGLPNKEAAARVPPEFAKDLPTDPVNMKEAISLNVDFWIDNAETLTQRFNAWLAQ